MYNIYNKFPPPSDPPLGKAQVNASLRHSSCRKSFIMYMYKNYLTSLWAEIISTAGR